MIKLVIPPVSDCFMPTLGTAQIAGFLKENGIDCKVIDANAELLRGIFNEVQNCSNELKEVILDGNEYNYKNVLACLNYWSSLQKEIWISNDEFETDFCWNDFERVIEFVNQETEFHKCIRQLSFMSIEEEKADIFGISISYESQVVPTLVLAKEIKKKSPYSTIVIGGSFLYTFYEEFYKLLYLIDWVDYLVLGAGELFFLSLEDRRIELDKIDGINVTNIGRKTVIDTRGCLENPTVYIPFFSDINFALYPTKEKAFPYMIKDKCYYGQCNFCNGDRVTKQNVVKNTREALKAIKIISDRIHVENVYFVDAALSPKDIRDIANSPYVDKINWIANGRFENEFNDEALIREISQKGCTMLRFGLESGSQKVLDLMNKGTKIETIERILQLTASYGIRNHLYIMFGYPGEEEKDREATIDFLTRNRRNISSYSISVFQPIPGTRVYERLSEQLPESENEYKLIIDNLYDEKRYNDIRRDIIRVEAILKRSSKTNKEYYSANVFNTYERSIVLWSNKNVLKNEEFARLFGGKLRFKVNQQVLEKDQNDNVIFYLVDFYKSKKVCFLVSSSFVAEYLGINGERIMEIEELINNGGRCFMNRNFEVKKQCINDDLGMSIQFMP